MESTKSELDHVPPLDGLRATAALLVLWEHWPSWIGGPALQTAKRLMSAGYLGVDVFFVLSGFLITRILIVDKRAGKPLRNFLFRRFLRIFPIYYLSVAVSALWQPGPYVVFCALYLSNFYFVSRPVHLPLHHSWSLSVEEHFYLVWPLVTYRLSETGAKRVAAWVLIPLAVLSAAVIVASGYQYANRLIYMGTMCRASSLALGALMAFYERPLRAPAGRQVLAAFAILCLLMMGAHLALHGEWKSIPRMVFFSTFSGLVVLTAVRAPTHSPWLSRVMSTALITAIGRISYGLYLYHYPIYIAFGVLDQEVPTAGALLRAVAALVATFAVASVSYFLIERPLLKLKLRFR